LKALLTAEEYDSAQADHLQRLLHSPTVIQAMHEALARLGIPANAAVLEPGCAPAIS